MRVQLGVPPEPAATGALAPHRSDPLRPETGSSGIASIATIPPERRALEATEALHGAIDLERVRSLYANAPIGVIAEFLAVAAIAGAMYGVASETPLVVWAGFMAACGMVRLFLWMQSRSPTALTANPQRWEQRYVIAVAAAGFGWGATVPTFLPVDNLLLEGIVALVISAVTVLSVDVLLASRRAATWFVTPALAIPALALAGYGGMMRLGTSLLMFTFLGVLIAGVVVGWLVRKLLTAAALGWADRLAGGAVALVAALVAAAFLLLPVVAWMPGGVDAIEGSKLAPYVAAVADLANVVAPDDLAQRWHERIEALRKQWRGGGAREVVALTR